MASATSGSGKSTATLAHMGALDRSLVSIRPIFVSHQQPAVSVRVVHVSVSLQLCAYFSYHYGVFHTCLIFFFSQFERRSYGP